MNEKLTPAYAETVDLSRRPFKRQKQAKGMLADPALVGSWHIEVGTLGFGWIVAGERDIMVTTLSPLVGRSALVTAAKAIEVRNNQG